MAGASAFTGTSRPSEGARRFDWSGLHAILEALPAGHWTSYGALAEVIGTAPQALGIHLNTCAQCPAAYRVLRSDGSIAAGFAWTDPTDRRDPLALLMEEGLAFTDGRADPAAELTADRLAELLPD